MLRRLLLALAAALGMLALVVAGLLLWLNTGAGREALLSRVDAVLGETGLSLTVDDPAGRWPGHLAAASVTLSDPAGPWLRIDGLDLRWSPWALLSGRIRVEALVADAIDFERLPSLPEGEPREQSRDLDPLRLLLRTRVERLDLGRLRLGDALLGEASAWRVEGVISAPDPAGLVHRLDIRRIDGRDDRLDLWCLQDDQAATLGVRGEWREAPGGAMVRLLGLDAGDGLVLTLEGDGPLDAWHGRLAARAGDAEVDLGFRRDGTPPVFRVQGRIDPAGLLPGRLDPVAAGGIQLDARVGHEPARSRLELLDLRLASDALRVEGRGSYDFDGGAFAASATITETVAGALAPLFGATATDGVTIGLEADGTVSEPTLRLTAEASALALAGVETGGLELTAEARRQSDDWLLAGRVDTARLAWSLDGSAPLVRGPAALEWRGRLASAGPLLLEDVALRLPDAGVTGRAEVDLRSGALAAPLSVAITDLRALAGLTRLDLAGAARLALTVDRSPGEGPLTLAFDGRTERLAVDLPVARALVSPAMTLAGRVTVGPATGVAIGGVRLAGERAAAEADLLIPPGFERLEGDARVEIADAGVLGPELHFDLAGPAVAVARFDGPLTDPALTGTLSVAAAGLGVVRWTGLDGAFELARLASGVAGPVQMTGRRGDDQARVEGRIELAEESFRIDGLRVSAAGAAAAGDLSLPLAGGAAAGELSLSVTDLAAVFRGTGVRAAGRANGLLRLFPEDGGQAGSLKLSGENLRLRSDPARFVVAKSLDVDARLRPGVPAPALALNARARGLRAPSVELDTLALDVAGSPARLSIGLEAAGEVLEAPATFTAGVATRLDGDHPVVVLERLDGALAGHPLASRTPATLTLRDGGVELDGLALDAGGGSLTAAARVGLPSPSLAVTAEALPLSLLSLADSRVDLAGTLSGSLSLAGEGPAAAGRVELALDPVRLANRRRVVDVTVEASGELRGQRLVFRLDATPPAGAPARLAGEIPLAVDLEGLAISQPRDGRLDARLDWDGDAADLMVLLPMNDHVLRGPARLELRLAGTVADPRIGGEVVLAGGYYEHLVAGTVLTPLDLRLVGDGDSLRIDRLEAGAGNGGRLTGAGRIGLDPGAGYPAALEFTFAEARVIRRDELTAVTDGRITIDGPLVAPEIVGRLDLREVEARLQNNLPPEVVELELVEAGSGRGAAARAAAAEEDTAPREGPEGRLAVEIRMPQRVFVRGLGIDSEWQGRLDLGGTPRHPTIAGRVELIRGVMIFLGRRFRLEDSVIRFPGGGEIEPELDVRAIYEGRVYVVTLAITGPATDTDISLSSQPELPESEILSQALFNKSTGELTAFEAVQLATAVAELTGRGGGATDALGRLRQAVGIDVLRVGSKETATGEQATSVEAGVYVAEGLYLGAETSTAAESGAVSVEYEVTRRIRIKTDLEQTGGQNIGIEYKRDY